MAEKENQQYKWRQRKRRNTLLTAWIIGVIIVAAAVTFVIDGTRDGNPLNVAKRYVENVIGVSDYKVETGARSLNNDNQFVQEYKFTYTADGKEFISRPYYVPFEKDNWNMNEKNECYDIAQLMKWMIYFGGKKIKSNSEEHLLARSNAKKLRDAIPMGNTELEGILSFLKSRGYTELENPEKNAAIWYDALEIMDWYVGEDDKCN